MAVAKGRRGRARARDGSAFGPGHGGGAPRPVEERRSLRARVSRAVAGAQSSPRRCRPLGALSGRDARPAGPRRPHRFALAGAAHAGGKVRQQDGLRRGQGRRRGARPGHAVRSRAPSLDGDPRERDGGRRLPAPGALPDARQADPALGRHSRARRAGRPRERDPRCEGPGLLRVCLPNDELRQKRNRMGPRRCRLGLREQAGELHRFPFALHRDAAKPGNPGALRDRLPDPGRR